MPWFSKKHDKVTVEFIESGKDKPFAVSTVPITQLPETFEIATTLDIGNKKWNVVEAIPKSKSDFEQTGKLRVILSPVHMANPKDILFSLPTINNAMCALQKAKSLDGMLVIHEDNWRQVEFVSENHLAAVETEINSIRTIHETKRKGAGFTGIHIRKLLEAPLDSASISYTNLKSLFPVSKEYNGFGIGAYTAVAENGFAFETRDGLIFFGVLNGKGNVLFLCLTASAGLADKCSALIKDFHLIGVDWCRCEIIRN